MSLHLSDYLQYPRVESFVISCVYVKYNEAQGLSKEL